MTQRRFTWHSYDVNDLLPRGWQESLTKIAEESARSRVLQPKSVTSREASSAIDIPVLTVPGTVLRQDAPWLVRLYEREFLELAQTLADEPVSSARDERIQVNLNVQRGTSMRYECHVDSNPIEGLLYVTTLPPGSGGELVVSQFGQAANPEEVDAKAATIFPVAGHLIFFDARAHPHYVRALTKDNSVRIVAAMNYYTPSCSEDMRPSDLNAHLFGDTSSMKESHAD